MKEGEVSCFQVHYSDVCLQVVEGTRRSRRYDGIGGVYKFKGTFRVSVFLYGVRDGGVSGQIASERNGE